MSNCYLFIKGEGNTRRLFSVTESGIENSNSVINGTLVDKESDLPQMKNPRRFQ